MSSFELIVVGEWGNIGEEGESPPEAEAKETRRKQTQRELDSGREKERRVAG